MGMLQPMKLESTKPFEEFLCYKNWHKGLGRWQVCLVHKETRARTTILFSKFIMSVACARRLRHDEQVDHLNGDRTDDSLANLEIVTAAENKARHSAKIKRTMVACVCHFCGCHFQREKRQVIYKTSRRYYCQKSCLHNALKKRS